MRLWAARAGTCSSPDCLAPGCTKPVWAAASGECLLTPVLLAPFANAPGHAAHARSAWSRQAALCSILRCGDAHNRHVGRIPWWVRAATCLSHSPTQRRPLPCCASAACHRTHLLIYCTRCSCVLFPVLHHLKKPSQTPSRRTRSSWAGASCCTRRRRSTAAPSPSGSTGTSGRAPPRQPPRPATSCNRHSIPATHAAPGAGACTLRRSVRAAPLQRQE